MALTPSNMLPLGSAAPAFSLPEPATGRTISLEQFSGQPLLVAFICNHCPFVIHIRQALADAARRYAEQGVAVVAISANDAVTYPADSPEKMVEEVSVAGYDFPYLYDENQSVARAYDAACTPDFYLFDDAHKLFYRGQFDSSRPSNGEPVTGESLGAAVDALVGGLVSPEVQHPSIGCGIKWK